MGRARERGEEDAGAERRLPCADLADDRGRPDRDRDGWGRREATSPTTGRRGCVRTRFFRQSYSSLLRQINGQDYPIPFHRHPMANALVSFFELVYAR
jgi:hypothetical protein